MPMCLQSKLWRVKTMSEDAYYTAIAHDRAITRPERGRGRPKKGTPQIVQLKYQPKRLFRQSLAEQEAMIPRLAKAIACGDATHRISANSITGEKTWLLRDQAPEGDWWMIDPHIEKASRSLISLAMDELQGRADMSVGNIVQVIKRWEVNDLWTVLLRRDPASRMANGATPKQLAKAESYATRNHS